jgi:hypothetical protein
LRRTLAVGIVLSIVCAGNVARLDAQSTGGPRLGVQFEGLFLSRGSHGLLSSEAISPFLALEVGILSRLSLRVGLSPPMGSDTGRQAYATHLALGTWIGKGPGFLELGIGSYYQANWCNMSPEYKAYTLSLGWRQVAGKMVFRVGVVGGLEPGGRLAVGFGIGFGRATGPGVS